MKNKRRHESFLKNKRSQNYTMRFLNKKDFKKISKGRKMNLGHFVSEIFDSVTV